MKFLEKIKRFKNKRKLTMMKQLIQYFTIIIILMFSVNLYSINSFKSYYENSIDDLDNLLMIQHISTSVDKLNELTKNYVSSGSLDYVYSYNNSLIKLQKNIKAIKDTQSGDDYYKIVDIGNMVISYDELNKKIFDLYITSTSTIYLNKYLGESDRIKVYIQNEVKDILDSNLRGTNKDYMEIGNRIQFEETFNYVIAGFIAFLCVLFAIQFSSQLSNPIHELAMKMGGVPKGDFKPVSADEHNNEEINTLINAFNNMTIEMNELIEKIKGKAKIEKDLKEQEIKNLETVALLNQSELNFLQSQINPHFLFNTLNTIVALSDLEEASYTKQVLEALAEILRYNLGKLNTYVAISEEFQIIKNYLFIQKTRFGCKINYEFFIDEDIMDVNIPSMIIQPLIENSVKHGLEPKIGKGTIQLSIVKLDKGIKVTVIDDGVGINEERLKEIMDKANDKYINYKDNIGIVNVIRRLNLIYLKNVVNIKSTVGEGTEVTIEIPII